MKQMTCHNSVWYIYIYQLMHLILQLLFLTNITYLRGRILDEAKMHVFYDTSWLWHLTCCQPIPEIQWLEDLNIQVKNSLQRSNTLDPNLLFTNQVQGRCGSKRHDNNHYGDAGTRAGVRYSGTGDEDATGRTWQRFNMWRTLPYCVSVL